MNGELIQKITIAVDAKPEFGEPCNHCGWCCLTEVCSMGKALTGSATIPCRLLEEKDGKHLCSVGHLPEAQKAMGMGVGCDAMTQEEMLRKL